MPATGNSTFMLELIVYRVTLTDQIQMHNTCPVCVCFRFPGLVELVVCEVGFCADGNVGDGEILMTNGKSCLFPIDNADLCRAARDFCAKISVNRRVDGEQKMRYVAQTHLEFDRTFTEVILNPNQVERSRKLKRVLPLYEKGRPNPVGSIEFFVQLTSQGDQYKAVPMQPSTVNCPERKPLPPKKICKHKASCRKNRPKSKEDLQCAKELRRRSNYILTIMEKVKALYNVMETINEPLRSGRSRSKKTNRRKRCLFDRNCPVANCPFRKSEPENTFVDHPIKGTRPGDERPPKKLSEDRELVDDANLFVINVGRVDPCRVKAPKYKDGSSQYFESDFLRR
ncbi:LOW QUALITY PROTEIN: uncharacterized protein LOC132919609 [Rhopalosiphum padi]|uniref:LOW QUALITY PROTEIN: uncharacterized protein LOC132919609 n=1 Tax=Rhopalosiphum padi TaxID=40932 RepID=UPI00298DEF40|nr:LOW QUALITY PROTEIN: uncharacterized protein LOC132919609 [Rhopalosiphum padi]